MPLKSVRISGQVSNQRHNEKGEKGLENKIQTLIIRKNGRELFD